MPPPSAKPSPDQPQFQRAEARFANLRDRICSAFESIEAEFAATSVSEPGSFTKTPWTRPEGGGGTMSIMTGSVFEKVGVHVSTVHGTLDKAFAKSIHGAETNPSFCATGISLIAHMHNPHVPAVHMNCRYIITQTDWFGGGADLTPLLAHDRHSQAPDTLAFHTAFKGACDGFDPDYYPRFREDCDRYFYLPHRQEPRGTGGIFFDHFNTGDFETDLDFVSAVGETFLNTYPEIVRGRMNTPWSADEREAQLIQRGRYVEFNLLYDRGTLFGLKTGGYVPAILSSMPPMVKWV